MGLLDWTLGTQRKPGQDIPETFWQDIQAHLPLLRGLPGTDARRLRQMAQSFLRQKQIEGAAGLEVDDAMRARVALLACLPILNLGLDCYQGWVSVVLYPAEFVPQHEYMDEAGVVHVTHHPMIGEAWLQGPIILSWAEVAQSGHEDGVNVVIHECVHKLDMLDGDANGCPPLREGMDRREWSRVFSAAYADFCRRVDGGEETPIDPYAAENPGEFLAVMSEAFFEIPDVLNDGYPELYRQLAAYYAQDPLQRMHTP